MYGILGLAMGCLIAGTSVAAAPQGSGSVTVNGKKFELTHGIAWKAGHMMGIPTIQIMLAEKSLDDLNWWASDESFRQGTFGVALILKPVVVPEDKPGQATYHYIFDADYNINLRAPDYGDWQEQALSKEAVRIKNLSVTNGVVNGSLEWSGSVSNPYVPEQTVTAWSATFNLPLKDVGPMPKH